MDHCNLQSWIVSCFFNQLFMCSFLNLIKQPNSRSRFEMNVQSTLKKHKAISGSGSFVYFSHSDLVEAWIQNFVSIFQNTLGKCISLEENPPGQASHVHGGSWSCWKRREPWKPPPSGWPKASHQGGLVAGWISSVVMLFKGCCGKKTCSHSLSIHGVRLVAATGPSWLWGNACDQLGRRVN